MRIVVASGKGGTGKTMIAVSLALSLAEQVSLTFADADVEEPNAHIFLKPNGMEREPVTLLVPEVRPKECTGCGVCAEVCAFNALAVVQGRVLLFAELCHGCGGCTLLCPHAAVREVEREIGVIEKGMAGPMTFLQGQLHVGEVLSPLVISQMKDGLIEDGLTIIDAPPGTSCAMVEAVRGADHCLLVTEPTPFGEHDLRSAVEVARKLGVKASVVVNRCDVGDQRVVEYCQQEAIPIVARFPYSRPLAEALAEGVSAWAAMSTWRHTFADLAQQLGLLTGGEGVVSCDN